MARAGPGWFYRVRPLSHHISAGFPILTQPSHPSINIYSHLYVDGPHHRPQSFRASESPG